MRADVIMLDDDGGIYAIAYPALAYACIMTVYGLRDVWTYTEIADRLDAIADGYPVAELKAAADRFGVFPLGRSKAAIVLAIQTKIERHKSIAVRCSF